RRTTRTFLVNCIVNGAIITFLKYSHMDNSLANKNFVLNFCHAVFTIFSKDNNIVNIRTLSHELILTHPCTNKSFLSVDVEFGICQGYLGRFHLVKHTQFSLTFATFGIFGAQLLKPSNSVVRQVAQVAPHLFDIILQSLHQVVGLFDVKSRNTTHGLVDELFIIFGEYFPIKLIEKWCKQAIQHLYNSIKISCILVVRMFVHPFLDENFKKVAEKYLFLKLPQFNFQLLFQQRLGL